MHHAPFGPGPLLVVAGFDVIFALRRSDGGRAWTLDFRERGFFGDTLGHPSSPPVFEFVGRSVLAALPDRLLWIDYLSGQILAEHPITDDPQRLHRPQLVVAEGQIFLYTADAILAFDQSGRLQWSTPHDLKAKGMRGSPSMGVPGHVRSGDGI